VSADCGLDIAADAFRSGRVARFLGVQALPFVFSLVIAIGLTPRIRRRLSEAGMERVNYRGVRLPVPIGVAIVPAALVALIPIVLLARLTSADVFPVDLSLVIAFVPGVALLGLVDDVLSGSSRGWRGHASQALKGGFSSGLLKAAGTLGLALLVASSLPGSDGEFLLAAAVLVLATNAFNLLDLRPGRSVKAFLVLGLVLTVATQITEPLAALGLFIGPVLVCGFFDLRERAMLGDTGSNVVGALAGLWIVLTLGSGEQVVALVVLAIINIYGEFRSISTVIEKVPGLRHLDSLGRPS
jgi:UDP-N-acetylmuramyl pentapeptide phosphotransferase/UDP-N-acetylglucosamine-1-phosphate transferase